MATLSLRLPCFGTVGMYWRSTGTVIAATPDLAAKPLRCGSCGHRQPFAPEAIVRARRRPNGRRASQQAAALIGRLNQ